MGERKWSRRKNDRKQKKKLKKKRGKERKQTEEREQTKGDYKTNKLVLKYLIILKEKKRGGQTENRKIKGTWKGRERKTEWLKNKVIRQKPICFLWLNLFEVI